MLDAALIEKCADPSLTPAIVEQFVQAAGSPDPLSVTVKSGGRLVLVPKPKSPEEALEIVREHVGRAFVRVGLTQFPAGVGVKDASELQAALVDPCENLRMGTKMFAKVMRIVAKWYGNPTGRESLPQIFDDAVYSWRTGEFEGVGVFQADESGTSWKMPAMPANSEGSPQEQASDDPVDKPRKLPSPMDNVDAEIRVDLSRINGK